MFGTITYHWPCLHTVTVCIPRLEFHLSRQFMVAKLLHRWYLMNTETEVKEQFISNYCDELEKTLKDVHRSIRTNIDVAQSKQKKGYDEHNDVDRSTSLKEGDRVWLNNKAVPKCLSRKFHSPWTGPYV